MTEGGRVPGCRCGAAEGSFADVGPSEGHVEKRNGRWSQRPSAAAWCLDVPTEIRRCWRLPYLECQQGQLVGDVLIHWQPMQFFQQRVRVDRLGAWRTILAPSWQTKAWNNTRNVRPECDQSNVLLVHYPLIPKTRNQHQACMTYQLQRCGYFTVSMTLGGVVVSALVMRTRRPRFESRVAPLFHWVATLGKLFTHTASPVSQLQKLGYKREFSAPKWLWWLSALH